MRDTHSSALALSLLRWLPSPGQEHHDPGCPSNEQRFVGLVRKLPRQPRLADLDRRSSSLAAPRPSLTPPEQKWFTQVELYGGKNSKITSISADATAFAERSQLFTIQFYASSSNYQPPYPASGFTFLDEQVSTITSNNGANWPYGSVISYHLCGKHALMSYRRAYANYVDDRLTTAQWQSEYYGSHYTRLAQIKRTYDPRLVFFFPQVIKPA